MLRLAQGLAFVLTLILAVSGPFAGSAKALDGVQEMLGDRVLGNPDAPVTIIEYASLGCPHCREFHDGTLPEIKKTYIDTGKVKLIFRDFPLGQRATAASMIARCSGPIRYFALVSIFFRDQGIWSQAPDGLAALTASAKKAGMSATQVDACLRSEELHHNQRRLLEIRWVLTRSIRLPFLFSSFLLLLLKWARPQASKQHYLHRFIGVNGISKPDSPFVSAIA